MSFDKKAWRKEYVKRPEVKAKIRLQNKRQKIKRRPINLVNARAKRARLRIEALTAYGGENPGCMCECGCKENRIVYLDLDHINNDGAEHRRRISCGGSGGFYAALKKLGWPKDPPIRVLCVKCNIGKQRNCGQCPELGIIEGKKKTPTSSRRTIFTQKELS